MPDTTAVLLSAADTPVDANGYIHILVRRDHHRPAQRNAISLYMWVQLTALLRDLDADRDVRFDTDEAQSVLGVGGVIRAEDG